jgi:catechol 2,3-dioxygenase-like lactoylglutathione lyase family enzyme
MQITANLIVDAIEPCLAFWCERLGFQITVEVPHDGRLGFVILVKDGAELMLQTRASMTDDVEPIAKEPFHSVVYVHVDDLAPIKKALRDVERVVADRRTFYGADEVIVRDPAGNVVFFAQRVETP